MPCAMPWGQAGDGSGAPEPVRHRLAMPVSVRTKAGWSMGGCVPQTHRGNGTAGIHPLPWGRTCRTAFRYTVPMCHRNPETAGMLVGFSRPGIHHSGLRTGSTHTPYSRRPMPNRDFAITLRPELRGANAGVGLSERVAGQQAGPGGSSVFAVDGRGIRMGRGL